MSCRLWAKQRRWADMKPAMVDLGGVAAISVPEDLRFDPESEQRTGDYSGFRFQRVNGHHLNGMTSYAEGLAVFLVAPDVDGAEFETLARRGTFDNFPRATSVQTERQGALNITLMEGDYSRDPVHEPIWCVRLLDPAARVAMTWWGYKKQYTPELARDNLLNARSRLKITGDVARYLQQSRSYNTSTRSAAFDQNLRTLNDALRGMGFDAVSPGAWSRRRDIRYLVDNGRPQQFHFVQSLGSIPAPDHPFRLTGPATFFKFVQNFWRQDNQGGGGGEIPHDDTGELTASMDRGRVYFFRIHSYNLWKPLDGAVADLLKQAEAEGEQMRRQFESGRLTGMDAER